jgi:tetratricopeptide (TPR) repeat protein
MKFRHLPFSLFLTVLFTAPFIHSTPALADLTLFQTTIADTQPDPPELKTAIALLVQEKYTEADIILKRLIQANPTHMATRDYYFASQDLQSNALGLATEYAERAYLDLPYVGYYFHGRDASDTTLNLDPQLGARLEFWSPTLYPEPAIALLKQQVDQNPDAIYPRLILASLENMTTYRNPERGSQGSEAIVQIRELVRRHPNDVQLQLILARNTLSETERTAAYQQSIRLNPQRVAVWLAYGNAVSFQDPAAAIEIYKTAIQANPNAEELYYQLGVLLQQNQRSAEAIAPLRQAIELQPQLMSRAWTLLFSILQQQEDPDPLMAEYQRFAAANPDDPHFNALL